uniref:Uncharacterized protein n=1 Tax=Knipowitschia caucasica TaxID=637954 RepID=A0AAV2KSD3_KNICA
MMFAAVPKCLQSVFVERVLNEPECGGFWVGWGGVRGLGDKGGGWGKEGGVAGGGGWGVMVVGAEWKGYRKEGGEGGGLGGSRRGRGGGWDGVVKIKGKMERSVRVWGGEWRVCLGD